ncbi:uncharacterized protein LOC135223805 [Macrobrachium nipponense]|uniref:uncharacterized protein LOC135223805 n=1 Tax=Macrobrachium nipponense TaxID=159736 RepID=UPI0030C8C107
MAKFPLSLSITLIVAAMLSDVIVTTNADCVPTEQNPLTIKLLRDDGESDDHKTVFGLRPLADDFRLTVTVEDSGGKKITLIIRKGNFSVLGSEARSWKPLPQLAWTEFQLLVKEGMFLELTSIQRPMDQINWADGTRPPYRALLIREKVDVYSWYCSKFGMMNRVLLSVALALNAIMTFTGILYWTRKWTAARERRRQTEANNGQGLQMQEALSSTQRRIHHQLQRSSNAESSAVPNGMGHDKEALEFHQPSKPQEQRGPDAQRDDDVYEPISHLYERMSWLTD